MTTPHQPQQTDAYGHNITSFLKDFPGVIVQPGFEGMSYAAYKKLASGKPGGFIAAAVTLDELAELVTGHA